VISKVQSSAGRRASGAGVDRVGVGSRGAALADDLGNLEEQFVGAEVLLLALC